MNPCDRLVTHGWDFTLSPKFDVVLDTFTTRFKKKFSSSYRQEQAEKLALLLSLYLQELPRQSPSDELFYSSTAKGCKIAKKLFFNRCKDSTHFRNLKNNLSAYLLGINTSTAEKNPKFFEWAAKSCLHSYLAFYRHKIEVDPITEKVSVLFHGRVTPWDEVNATMPEVGKTPPFKEIWRAQYYDQTGVILKDRYKNQTCKPLIVYPEPPWGKRYVLIIKMHGRTPHISCQPHGWLNLGDPNGTFLSYEKFRQLLKAWSTGIHPSDTCHPASSDTWEGYTIDGNLMVEITQSQFDNINADQILFDNAEVKVPFHNFDDNCTNKCLSILESIARPTLKILPEYYTVSFWRVICPQWLLKPALALDANLPLFFQKLMRKVVAVAGNIICYIFFEGGSIGKEYVNPITGKYDRVDPRYPGKFIVPRYRFFKEGKFTLEDFLDENKMQFTSPYYVNQRVFKPIQHWRERRQNDVIAGLRPSKDSDYYKYALPKKWSSTQK